MALFIEPAPYMVRLADELSRKTRNQLSVYFLSKGLSQPWPEMASSKKFSVLPRSRIRALCVLVAALVTKRPKVLHVAGWGNPLIIVAIIIGRLVGAKVVASSDTWTSSAGVLRTTLKRGLLGLISGFCPGGGRQAAYLRNLGVSNERIVVARMTVDVRAIMEFQSTRGGSFRQSWRSRIGIADDVVVFAFIGRLSAEKGCRTLIAAFRGVLEAQPNCALLIAGDGPERESLEIGAAGLDSIHFLGRLDGEELWGVYSAADVYVGLSDREQWGLSVNEAMSSGLPAVLSDAFGCIGDLFIPDQHGICVHAGDVNGAMRAMILLSSQKELRSRMGNAGRVAVAGRTIESQAETIHDFWRRISGHDCERRT